MDINLNGLKSKNYIVLSKSLNELLFIYWKLLKLNSKQDLKNYLSLNYQIIETLNLKDEIKNIFFEDDVSYIGGDHPWIEIDRMNAFRWLSTLSPENLNVALNLMNKEQLQFVADMISAYQQANMENTHITKKICK